ncbi:MAG TPA: thiol-disulfide oxidoreductase, partial [Pantoea agglomerans]|nr:thiol-disulfide oxidoreductase [Pantoea agglomerans]
NRSKLFGRYSAKDAIQPEDPGRLLHEVERTVTEG